MLRSYHCGNEDCLQYMSQCQALRIVERGGKNQVYSRGTAQYHWGVSPRDKWVLFNVKKDPGCRDDLAAKKPELIARLSSSYQHWWEKTYPEMIAKGGDLGDPNQGRRASARDREWKAKKEANAR